MREVFVIILSLFMSGCFLNSKMTSLNELSSSQNSDPTKIAANYIIRPLSSTQSVSKLMAFEIEFSEDVSTLGNADLNINGGSIHQIEGGPKIFRVEVMADDYSSVSVVPNANLKFANSNFKLPAEPNKFEAVPNLQEKSVVVNAISQTGFSFPKEAPDGSVYFWGDFQSWTTNPGLFGSLGIYDTTGQRLSIGIDTQGSSLSRTLYTFPDSSYLYFDASTCYIRKYGADGTVDNSFASVRLYMSVGSDPVTWCNFNQVNTVIRQASGKIIIAGKFGAVNNTTPYAVMRLNTDGTIDSSFVGTPMFSSDTIYQVIEAPDTSLYFLGTFMGFNGNAFVGRFVKTDANGNVDAAFYANRCCTAPLYANGPLNMTTPKMYLASTGQIYILGITDFTGGSLSYGIELFSADGVRSTAFVTALGTGFQSVTNGNLATYNKFNGIMQADGRMIFASHQLPAGSTLRLNGVDIPSVFRLNLDGTRDTSFGFTPINNGTISINASNQIEIRHGLASYELNPSTKFLRVLPNGQIQNGGAGILNFNNLFYDIAIDKNGKFYFAGSFTTYGASTTQRLLRLNNDFSLDTTFDTTTGFNNAVAKIILLENNRILVVGSFTSYKGTAVGGIAVLDSNANLVNGPNYAGFAGGLISGIKLLSGNRIAVWGTFTTYQGQNVQRLVLLNADLTPITTFQPQSSWGGTPPYILDVCENKAQQIIAVGARNSGGGGSVIVRMNSTGAPDLDFNAKMPTYLGNEYVSFCTSTSDDSLIVGGKVTNFQGINREGAIHITKSGAVNPTFMTNASFPSGRISPIISGGGFPLAINSFKNFSILSSTGPFLLDGTKRVSAVIFNPF